MHREGVGKFLQEMAPELEVMGLKYIAEAELSAARALSRGKNFL